MALPPSTFAERTEKEKGGRGSEDGGGATGCSMGAVMPLGTHEPAVTSRRTLEVALLYLSAYFGNAHLWV